MSNKLTDINEYLFEQLDVLSNPDLKDEDLEKEIKRSKQITAVSKTIIDNGRLLLDAQKHADDYFRGPNRKMPTLLETKDED